MAGEFMKLADGVTRLILGVGAFFGFLILVVTVWLPYCAYRNTVDAVKRATGKTTVWICEDNMAIRRYLVPVPLSMIEKDGHRYYACVDSIKDAEDWLLEKGYNKTIRFTQRIGNGEGEHHKEFFVKYVPGTKAVYSYVSLRVDYGDQNICLIPYQYPKGESPVNFSRFKEENWEASGGDGKTPELLSQPPMPWTSSDGVGRNADNHEAVDEFNFDWYVKHVK